MTPRLKHYTDNFRDRLATASQNRIKVNFDWERPPVLLAPIRDIRVQKMTEEEHRWLTCMEKFRNAISNIEHHGPTDSTDPTILDLLNEKIHIALIDDGVEILDHRNNSGRAPGNHVVSGYPLFVDEEDDESASNRVGWISETGHGTIMASFIQDIFPQAVFHSYRVKMNRTVGNGGLGLSVDPQSAIEV